MHDALLKSIGSALLKMDLGMHFLRYISQDLQTVASAPFQMKPPNMRDVPREVWRTVYSDIAANSRLITLLRGFPAQKTDPCVLSGYEVQQRNYVFLNSSLFVDGYVFALYSLEHYGEMSNIEVRGLHERRRELRYLNWR